MADKRISQLVERVDIANNDVVPIVASGATTTNKATISSIQTFMQENLDVGVTSVGITIGTSGTDVNVTGSPVTTSGNITINIPTASATNRGLLSAADWTTFNNKADAGNYVTLDTAQTITAQKTFTTSGGDDTLIVDHTSGSGIAVDISKAGNGEGLRVTKTSGSGNAVTITGGLLSAEAASFSGNIAANGGLTLAAAGTANPTILRNTSGTTSSTTGSNVIGFNGTNNIFVTTQSRGGFILGFNNSVSNREYTLPDASGTIALTSNLGAYLPLAGGTMTGTITTSDTGTASSIIITSDSIGSGAINLTKNTSGTGINVTNNGVGDGVFAWNNSTGTGITIGNISTGKGLLIANSALATGDPFVYTLGGAAFVKAKIDYLGNLTANQATLTGALNGTSASFSGGVTINGLTFVNNISDTTARLLLRNTTTGADAGGLDIREIGVDASINNASNGSLSLSTNNTPRLTLASTGAATFSSSVAGNALSLYTSYASGRQLNFGFSDGSVLPTAAFYVGNQTGVGVFIGDETTTNGLYVKAGGNVGIGTASPGAKLHVEETQVAWASFINHTNATDQFFMLFQYNGSSIGNIRGNNTSTAYNTSSDYRLKEDLQEINGIEKVSALRVYDFKWKGYETRMDGLLAHELAEVLPYAVSGEKDAVDEEGNDIMQGVDYSKIVPVLIKAIQELKTEIDSLKNQIKTK